MTVVAIIPTWNARERIGAVLAALEGQVGLIVVVDNGSTDGTPEWLMATQPDVTCIANRVNRGYPAAVNQALTRARQAAPDWLLLVNDDAVFESGAVEALIEAMEGDPSSGAASAKMLYSDRPDTLNGTGGVFDPSRGWAALRGAGEPDAGQYDRCMVVDYPSGAASLMRRQAVDEVGAFDEDYFLYFEDTDWGLRAGRAGWRTIYVPAACVAHVGSAGTAGDPARRRYYNVRNRLLLARRYASAGGRIRAWLETLVLLAKQPLRWLSPSRRRDAEAVAAGVADHLRGRYGRSARFG